ncbi:MAG: hypothetical protein F9K32_07525 [Desulfobulbaceae bacterium]|nr:MAG: hypothetical protein F9K32_07525 [Desulfobulbaceae bacterium]
MYRKMLCAGAAVLVLLFAAVCQAGDKYEEASELFAEYVPALENYLDAVEKAQSAGAFAVAINAFADEMAELAPKMRELNRKYPELQNEQSVPPKYAELEQKADALGERFGQSFIRIAPFMEDPEVEKANERLMMIMESMAPEGE